MLKLNKLHFHLTDDNGWRIEIKKYPELTEIGSRRVDRPGKNFSERRNPRQGEPTVEKGYYTQDDIREIVAYAGERHIEVIPEIEMPAHSNAALAAYPLLACPVVNKYIGVLPGLGERMPMSSTVPETTVCSLSCKMCWTKFSNFSLQSISTWVEMRLGRRIGKHARCVRRG